MNPMNHTKPRPPATAAVISMDNAEPRPSATAAVIPLDHAEPRPPTATVIPMNYAKPQPSATGTVIPLSHTKPRPSATGTVISMDNAKPRPPAITVIPLNHTNPQPLRQYRAVPAAVSASRPWRRLGLAMVVVWLAIGPVSLARATPEGGLQASPSPLRVLARPPEYELAPVNRLSLKIAPSLGTQLYFPFVLDQVDSVVPFTVNVTNAEVFLVRTSQERNFILISVPPDAPTDAVGSLFIVVADRHLNIRLGVGNALEHTEAIYFTFSERVRAQLIDQAVEDMRVQMADEMAQRIAEAKRLSGREAIAYVAELAQRKPRRINVRENFSGQHHRLYLQRVWEYQKFSIIFCEIRPAQKIADDELRISAVYLSVGGEQQSARREGYLLCQREGSARVCTAVFDKLGSWQDHEQIEIEIHSNLGLDSYTY